MLSDTRGVEVLPFFDASTQTFSYIVKDPSSQACAIIDAVLDFDYAAGQVSYSSADRMIDCVKRRDLKVEYLLETHIHADHLSAAQYIKHHLGGKIAISEKVQRVQQTFGALFGEGEAFKRDGSQFDALLSDGQTYQIGEVTAQAIDTPGHTPACMAHYIADAVFVGDTLFMPDAGTARADFPGGSAKTLYQSIQTILGLPDETRMFVCHDYQPSGRELAFETTVLEQKNKNIHVNKNITQSDFIALREAKDKTLDMPRLIYPSLQINMRAGAFPVGSTGEAAYLKVPVKGINASLLLNK